MARITDDQTDRTLATVGDGPPASPDSAHTDVLVAAVRLSATRSLGVGLLKTMRPKQWAKNLLVFTPLITSHQVFDEARLLTGTVAFVCFCLCASAVYVLNDLIDLEYDRQHTQKRYRPLASGSLAIAWGIPLACLLLLLGFSISVSTLPLGFCGVLLAYVIVACGYSWLLKRIVMLDVLTLAGLYTVRVLAGGIAIGIVVSEWLIAFSVFLFASLAFVKRYAELDKLSRTGAVNVSGRGYRTSDVGIIEGMGTASGLIAVLVLAMYVNGEQSKQLYANPWPIWLICPVLMYWIGRIWILAKRGELSEDPVVYALGDRVSRCVAVLIAALLALASMQGN